MGKRRTRLWWSVLLGAIGVTAILVVVGLFSLRRAFDPDPKRYGEFVFGNGASGTVARMFEIGRTSGKSATSVEELLNGALASGLAERDFMSALGDGPVLFNPDVAVWIDPATASDSTVYCVSPSPHAHVGHETPVYYGVDGVFQFKMFTADNAPGWIGKAAKIRPDVK